MLFSQHPVIVRGGGDLATGAVFQLHQAGFPVIVLELADPLAIRRKVSFASAITEGEVLIEHIPGVKLGSIAEALAVAGSGLVPVIVSPDLPRAATSWDVVVDARMAKTNLDTTIDDASLVVGLGPGFAAGADCHRVVETKRGHRLGRVIEEGTAEPDTGIPGQVGGATADRVVRAGDSGIVSWLVSIGDEVSEGDRMGNVGETAVVAGISGVVRGLLTPGFAAKKGTKIADIDPRGNREACFEISDKARLVGAGVLESVLVWRNGIDE